MDLYRDVILDHYKNPRNYGRLEHPDAASDDANPSCGDRISVGIRFAGSEGERRVGDIRFTGEGCAIHTASASMLTEKVKGMYVADILTLTRADVEKLLGTTLTPSRVKCALLPLEAIQQAIQKQIIHP